MAGLLWGREVRFVGAVFRPAGVKNGERVTTAYEHFALHAPIQWAIRAIIIELNTFLNVTEMAGGNDSKWLGMGLGFRVSDFGIRVWGVPGMGADPNLDP